MVKQLNKQLSNPFSTGGGGSHFEAHVQASFVVLMLTGGYAPCMPNWPIKKIKLQGRVDGYETDDLIIFLEKLDGTQKRKILGQVKHVITIAEGDKIFREVIESAWRDFNNPNLFTKGKDVIALITGPLSKADIEDVRTILEWSRYVESAEEFFTRVEQTHYSSRGKRNKLQAFRSALARANADSSVSEDLLFEFLKHFHILGYDLDMKSGLTLSLLHSLIGFYSQDSVSSLWARIVEEVQSTNKNAGTISLETLSDDLRLAFTRQTYAVIPDKLSASQRPIAEPDWNQPAYATDLAVVAILGSWDERNDTDIEIIRKLTNEDYAQWIVKIREILQLPNSPIILKNGKWRVRDREILWNSIGSRIFDDQLDTIQQCAVRVLTERDPQFDLSPDDRQLALIKGKTLKYSSDIRKGLAETLALLGNTPDALVNCSQFKPGTVAQLAVREIFANADWVLWGSSNDQLPTLAEAAPAAFLNAVEEALQDSSPPFDELFAQESSGIFGRNYMTGLLWALETLAWDELYLVRVCVILGELAARDPGGNSANRPLNSLTSILLPWHSQTTASIEKRKITVKTLEKEVPQVAWNVLISLLPNQHQATFGTHKPSWRKTIPDDWKEGVMVADYWNQVDFYVDLALTLAKKDKERLLTLTEQIDDLPQKSVDALLDIYSSEEFISKPEDERLEFWDALVRLASKHRRLPNAEWAWTSQQIQKVEIVASKLAPTNPMNLHRRIFTDRQFDLFEAKMDWKEQSRKLEKRRQQAIWEILVSNGVDGVIHFVNLVDSSRQVGYSFGVVAPQSSDNDIFPSILDLKDQKHIQFISSYIWGRLQTKGWEWVDGINKTAWSSTQIGLFLSYLPFTVETWDRASRWLRDLEKEYWTRAIVNPYQTDCDLIPAIDKLILYKRPNAAIDCLNKQLHDKQLIDKSQCVNALLSALSSEEPSYTFSKYDTVELIKALQDDPDTNPDDLFQLEWAYLPILNEHNGASPKYLANRLASDPAFFCEIIRLIYRSKKESQLEEVTEEKKAIATNAWRLLEAWKIPPGTQYDGSFSSDEFIRWLNLAKKSCEESGHLEVALSQIGEVLLYSPSDPSGLWIHSTIAAALNDRSAEKMRNGLRSAIINSRGVHTVDPTGKPERELASLYRQKAEGVENEGFQRLAATLRGVAEFYDREAERIVAEHGREDVSCE